MADVLVRDVSDAVVERLRVRAERRGRTLEAELRALIEGAAGEEESDRRWAFHEVAARMRERYAGTPQTPAVELLREDRDR